MKNQLKERAAIIKFAVHFSETLIISILVFLAASPFSCRMPQDEQAVNITGKTPVIESITVTGKRNLRLIFSDEVKISDTAVIPKVKISNVTLRPAENGKKDYVFDCVFEENLKAGEKYVFSGRAEDNSGNSLTFELPFTGFNDKIPKIEITEVHPKYSSISQKDGSKLHKIEYIELYILSAGNLAGLEIFSANDGAEKSFKFPPVNVNPKEVVLVHFRNNCTGCKDELTENISLASAKYSSNAARDLWDKNDKARLGDDTDVILVRNCNDGSILDAVLYASSEAKIKGWKNSSMEEAAKAAAEAGVWQSADITSAITSDGITAAKSLIKKGNENSAKSWEISKSGKETPGVR